MTNNSANKTPSLFSDGLDSSESNNNSESNVSAVVKTSSTTSSIPPKEPNPTGTAKGAMQTRTKNATKTTKKIAAESFANACDAAGIHPNSYVLAQIDLYNWGPFSGRFTAQLDARGAAIIGPTGSGKTTVVDALMTLLTHKPRYNLASTGGRESDRDLISYIRGATGSGNQSDYRHIARKNKTVTAISALFCPGSKAENVAVTAIPANSANAADSADVQEWIQITAIFWIDSTSNAASDRKDIWLVTKGSQISETNSAATLPPHQAATHNVDEWLTLHHEGGARGLKQFVREADAQHYFDSKKAYLSYISGFFQVNTKAFTLLNRATGLKQLSSVNDIFRELVLDEDTGFATAEDAVQQFQNLKHIRAELEKARKQVLALKPLQTLNQKYRQTDQRIQQWQHLSKHILPAWFARARLQLWQAKKAQLEHELHDHQTKLKTVQTQLQQQQQELDILHERYMQLGGNTEQQLQQQIRTQQQLLTRVESEVCHYQKVCSQLQLDTTLSDAQLVDNKNHARALQHTLQTQHAQQQQRSHELAGRLEHMRQRHKALQEEKQSVLQRPGSNVPYKFQQFRSLLAEQLRLPEDALPYVAELMEVAHEHANWRGAVERAIGSHRLRLLVPQHAMGKALHWVNARDNQLHVRLLQASTQDWEGVFFEDSFVHKLNFKPHALLGTLQHMLAGIDRHCVEDTRALENTPHGLTQAGMMSNKSGYFDKQDQRKLSEGWITGFDNRDSLAQLQHSLSTLADDIQADEAKYEQARTLLNTTAQQLELIKLLLELEFDTIDLPSQTQQMQHLQQQLAALTNPTSDLGKIRLQHEAQKNKVASLYEQESDCKADCKATNTHIAEAHHELQQAQNHAATSLQADEEALGAKHLPKLDTLTIKNLPDAHRTSQHKCNETLQKQKDQLADLSNKIVRQMGAAKAEAPGQLVEVGTDLSDMQAYLDCLRELEAESLPAKQARFLEYLNESAGQGVSNLLASIENTVTVIEERIAELNATLHKVDFQPNNYLQLTPTPVRHPVLRDLEAAQKHLRHAMLKDDAGESHYRALEQLIALLEQATTNKRTLAAKAMLDARYRLQFSVSVLARDTGDVLQVRTDSKGDSGGEKEIITSYILIASLRYALTPRQSSYPIFATVILDEAFSRTSQAVAGRIVSTLREFGLHALFVTPNKELRLLRQHTRSAIVVHRKQQHSSLLNLSWEELDAQAQKRLQDIRNT